MNPVASLLEMVIISEPWIDDALCAQVDGDEFFPDSGGTRGETAKSTCARCGVVKQCLEYALRNNETQGIWGGKTARQRRRMRGIAS